MIHKILFAVLLSTLFIVAFCDAQATKICFSSMQTRFVYSCDTSGANVDTIVTTLGSSGFLDTDPVSGRLYIAVQGSNGLIASCNYDGTVLDTIVPNNFPTSAVVVDESENKIYYSGYSNGTIFRADYDGSNVLTLVTGLSNLNDFAIDFTGGKIYWLNFTGGTINRCDMDGSNSSVIVSGLSFPAGIKLLLSRNEMFWTEFSGNVVKKANLDGTNIVSLVTGVSGAAGIVLDSLAEKMYFTGYYANAIYSANLDGTGSHQIVTGVSQAYGIALLDEVVVGVDDEIVALPENFSLQQNYPNPFNPTTTITFTTLSQGYVSLKIYDVLGRELAVLVNEELPVGNHIVSWTSEGEPSGVYFYRLQANGFTETKAMVLSR